MALSIGSKKRKTAVFISGNGSNLRSLIKFSRLKKSPISIDLIISDNLKAKGLIYAKIFKINKKVFQFKNKKVRTADINPILHKIARFNSVNRKNKKRDKSKKEDLSRVVHPIELFSKQSLTFLKKLGD